MGMFSGEAPKVRQEGSGTVIGSSIKVEGKFVGRGNVDVEGKVVCSIKTDQDLHIHANATVRADVDAKNVFVAGEVHGNIHAQERLELAETAKVTGDVLAKVVTIAAGATMNGKCAMASDAIGEKGSTAQQDNPQDKMKPKTARAAETF